jgi:uncharacterized protein (TIRG00374 family)
MLRYLGLVLLVALVWHAGPRNLLTIWGRALPWWLALAWILNLPQIGLKALRWWLSVRWQGIALSYPRALLAYFSSLLAGFLTPGRVGELSKVFTLKYECGVPLAKGLSSVILDRAFDFYLLLALGAIGLVRFALVGSVLPWWLLAALAVLFLLPLTALNPRVVRRMARLGPVRPRLREKAGQFADGLEAFSPGRLALCAVLTAAAYAIFFLQVLLCAWSLGFTVPFRDLVLLMAATNLLTFLPISISGLGTREAALIYFLARIRPPQPADVAVALGLVIFMVFFVGGGLIGFVCWQWAPIGLRRAVHEARTARDAPPGEDS